MLKTIYDNTNKNIIRVYISYLMYIKCQKAEFVTDVTEKELSHFTS